MKRFLKFTLIGFGILLSLLMAAFLAVVLLLDLNDYKGEINAAVKEATGRDLTIGNLDFSLYPELSIVAQDVSFSNAKGFSKTPMASLKRVQASLLLRPLFSKEIHIGHLSLDGGNVQLGRNIKGVFSWDDLVPQLSKDNAKDSKSEGLPFAIVVGGVAIKDTQFVWDDRQEGMKVSLDKINVDAGTFSPVSTFPLKASLAYALSSPELKGAVAVDGSVSMNLPKLQFGVQDFKVEGDADGLVKAALRGVFDANYAGDDIKISMTKTSLNECAVNGDVHLKFGDKPFYQVDLKVGDLDLDKYLPKQGGEQAAESSEETEQGEAQLFDKEMLRSLHFDVKLVADSLTVNKVRMEKLTVSAKAKDGVIDVHPLSFGLYDGTIDSAAKLNAAGDTTLSQAAAKAQSVNLGNMAKAMGDQGDVGGLLDLELEIAAAGETFDAMKQHLNGKAMFNLADGVFPGVDLFKLARKTQESEGEEGTIEGDRNASTEFGQVSGSFVIADGIVVNEDLDVKAPGMRAFGHGGVSLVSGDIDYIVRVKLVATQEGQGGSSAKDTYGVMVPVRVAGTYDNPYYWVSLPEYIKALAGTALDLTGGVFNLGTGVLKGVGKGTGSILTGVGRGLGSLIPGFGSDKEQQQDEE